VTGENRTLVERSTVARLSHSATVTSGARGTSRTCLSSFSDWRLDRNGHPGEIWLRAGELNATRLAYEASMTPVHLPARKDSGARGGIRNPTLRVTSAVLFHLSYSGMSYMERVRRIELR
jgi:hypothetical protein